MENNFCITNEGLNRDLKLINKNRRKLLNKINNGEMKYTEYMIERAKLIGKSEYIRELINYLK